MNIKYDGDKAIVTIDREHVKTVRKALELAERNRWIRKRYKELKATMKQDDAVIMVQQEVTRRGFPIGIHRVRKLIY